MIVDFTKVLAECFTILVYRKNAIIMVLSVSRCDELYGYNREEHDERDDR